MMEHINEVVKMYYNLASNSINEPVIFDKSEFLDILSQYDSMKLDDFLKLDQNELVSTAKMLFD